MLYFVRHGQTDWNAEHRLQSRSDIPLNDTGQEQACRIARKFAERRVTFAHAATSPLVRARDTARIVLASTPLSITVYAELTEIDLGDYEGRREDELRSELGDRYAEWRHTYFATAAPNGESRAQAGQRIRRIIERLAELAQREPVLVVGHQAINMVMKAELSRRTTADALRGYMQANDEIDAWDVAKQCLAERIRIEER